MLEFDSISFVDTYFYCHCLERDLAELYDLKCSLPLSPSVSACLRAVRVCLRGTFGTDLSVPCACFAGGFVKLPDVFRLGIMMALINISIWILVATPWWKILGLY